MKIALTWLEEYFVDKPDWTLVFDRLTQAGIEVEGVDIELDEKVVELKITPNRGDCLSILGLIREISVLTNYNYVYSYQFMVEPTSHLTVDITIEPKGICSSYVALPIADIDNTIHLPEFLLRRLYLSGIRSVSPIVDITNYVMLEIGQPLHAFDYDRVGGKLHVRLANDGESLTLIDNKTVKLTGDTLIVCNSTNQPAAIAGVMGGLESGVSANTKNIVLESAFFHQDNIVGKAKYYELSSDAAYRFERGVDNKIQQHAIFYAAVLINKYLGGSIGKANITQELESKEYRRITLEKSDFDRLIGINIPIEQIRGILLKLEFLVDIGADSKWHVIPPSHRFDIIIKEDVIEEVARVYGYDNIPALLPKVEYTMLNLSSIQAKVSFLKDILVARGYNEIISYAFVEEENQKLFNNYPIITNPIILKNPIAGLSVMRTSLFAGLIKSMQYNINHGTNSLKLFEIARVFYGEGEYEQPLKLAGLLYGDTSKTSWIDNKKPVDFYSLKGDVEVLLQHVDIIKFISCDDNPVLHGGRCAKICSGNYEIGVIGQLHPLVAQSIGLSTAPYLFELDIDSIVNMNVDFKLQPTSKFQKVERDLAFIIAESCAAGEIIDYIKLLRIENLLEVNIFDIYQGDNIDKGQKSVAIKLIFQDDRTLTDFEINTYLAKIIEQVGIKFNVKLR